MAKSKSNNASFASAGLTLFNATLLYELMAIGNSFPPIRKRWDTLGSWKDALREAYIAAHEINNETPFFYAIRVLDTLPSNTVVDQLLERIYMTVKYVISNPSLMKLDLTGRIYHSTLGKELAKAFATYYTGIPASELLAWIAVENWDDKVIDFACGSGTLLLAAYHKKLSIAYLHPTNRNVIIDELHSSFLENDLVGLDAMPFAVYLTMINLALQYPSTIYTRSQIYHVPVDHDKKMGSLDLLRGNCIWVQQYRPKRGINASQSSIGLSRHDTKIEFPDKSFDVVIMNPPFTKKQLVSQIMDKKELKKTLNQLGSKYTSLGGLSLPFTLLGDKYLTPGGRLAFVLPSSILDRSTWKGVRIFLEEKYHLEHLIISWINGKPSFSDDTQLREILLIARKKNENSKNGNFTLVTHLDKDFTVIEARQIAEQLLKVKKDFTSITINSPFHQPIYCESELVGETISFPKSLIEQTTDNWYRLLAFRNPKLVWSSLLQQGIITDSMPPYNVDFSNYQIPVSKVGKIGLFIKQVASAGFATLETRPVNGGIKSLMTSDYNCLSLKNSKCLWLVKDSSLKATEKFTPGTGYLLVPRKIDLYSTAKVLSIVSDDPVASNMWIPIEPFPQVTKDGKEFNKHELAKIWGLWLHSSFGVMLLVSMRHEIRGAWSEWVTEDVKKLPVLNLKTIDSSTIYNLLDLWEQVKDVKWETLYNQLIRVINDIDHPRRVIDEIISDCLLGDSNPNLDDFYRDLSTEIEKLGNLMKKK